MKIFVVIGSTGEYSDRTEWVVTAYTKEEDAKAHVTKASMYADAWLAFSRSDEFFDMNWDAQQAKQKAANPLDASFQCDYTGTSYSYAPVELREEFSDVESVH